MNWQPGASPDVARARAAMVDRMRRYFNEKKVLEVWTPILGPRTVTAPAIESIRVGTGAPPLYLQTSPEYFMKRLLAAGYPAIYQACRVFRDGEAGSLHLPEFTMVEWYRPGFDLSRIIGDTIDLADRLFVNRSFGESHIVDYVDAFRHALSIDPLEADSDRLADILDAPEDLRDSIGDDKDAWLDLAMARSVAPTFPADRLTVVRHYPASQASLARCCPADGRVADRFEVFCGAIELANGYVELTDADELEARFKDDQACRRHDDRHVPDIDESLIEALRSGLPNCAGVALGLDRLLMIDEGLDHIVDTVTFSPGYQNEH